MKEQKNNKMTLQELITILNNLAISKPELLTEQVSILEPDLEGELCSYEIDRVFVNNGSASLLILV